jgi:hypothetical protein
LALSGAFAEPYLLDINWGAERINFKGGRRFILTSQQMSAIYQQNAKTTQLIMLIN